MNLLQSYEPTLLSGLAEVGAVDKEFIDAPGKGPVSTATPLEVLERTLSGILERRPSLLASLGQSAIEVLSAARSTGVDTAGDGECLVVGFTDLEGFTRFTEREGDEPAAKLLSEHYRTAGPIVRSRGGRIIKRLGDGLLTSFTEPTAAVLGALELVDAAPSPLRVRAGLHQGDVVVERSDIVGHVVNVAARVTELAKGGEVLVSAQLAQALSAHELPDIQIGRLRRRRLKGLDQRVTVRPVRRKSNSRDRESE